MARHLKPKLSLHCGHCQPNSLFGGFVSLKIRLRQEDLRLPVKLPELLTSQEKRVLLAYMAHNHMHDENHASMVQKLEI